MGNCLICFKKSTKHSFSQHSIKQIESFRQSDKEKEKVFVKLMKERSDKSIKIPVLSSGRPFLIFGQNKKAKNFCYYFDQNEGKLVQTKSAFDQVKLLNYSGTIFLDDTRVMVCGGIQHNLTNISKQCIVLDLKNMHAEQYPQMNQIRYTFPLLLKDFYVYAIGGRVYGADDVSLLNKCERFNMETRQWETIADMNVNRCTSTAFLFRNEIYVFGGYTSRYKRSKKIEKYNELQNIWEVIDLKLYSGFENGNVVASPIPNRILILGGKLNYGSSKNVWEYDLIEKTVINKSPIFENGILTKYFRSSDDTIYIFGQSGEINPLKYYVERYDTHAYKNLNNDIHPLQNNNLEKFKQYNFTFSNIEVIYEEQVPFDYSQRQYEDINILFGTDLEPFQLEVHKQTGFVNIIPIPTNLALLNFQGVARINENELLFAGGINVSFKIIHEKSFLYNLNTREVIKMPNMSHIRYTFPLIKHKDYVYAIGGREYGSDQNAIFKNCERFNLNTQQWEAIGFLNKARCTSNAFICKDMLMVAGGFCQDSKRTNTIEIFDEKNLQWMAIGLQLPFPLEASLFVNSQDTIICFGGRQDGKGDNNTIFKLKFEEGDFEEPTLMKQTIDQQLCLHKGFHVGNSLAVFGAKKDFLQFFEIDSLKTPRKQDICSSSDLPYEVLQQRILDNLSNASYNKEYFIKNSFVTSM